MSEETKSCCSKSEGTCDKGSCGLVCPFTGICFSGRFLCGAGAMVIWMNLFSFLWHGKVLQGRYMETASLWRPEGEMVGWAITAGISLSAFIATFIFTKGFEGKGMFEGARFGIVMTLLFGGMGLVTYATQPIPSDILIMWAFGDLLGYSLGGILLGFIFKGCQCCKKSC